MFPANTKILVVDDMRTMRKIVMKVCKKLGFNDFIEAVDGKEAWEKLSQNPDIQLVISDWSMPNCTGIELLGLVRADTRFTKLPFLMVTAENESSQVMLAIQSGVSNYLVKPFTPEDLKLKLEAVYKRHYPSAAA